MSLNYVVAGTGRSGTTTMAKLLTLAGGHCGHEQIFNHDRAGTLKRIAEPGHFRGDASLAAFAYLTELEGIATLHLVRHPLEVAGSWLGRGVLEPIGASTPYGAFLRAELPELTEELTTLDRIGRYIIRQTELITLRARGAYRTLRIEDLDLTEAVEVMQFLGIPAPRPLDLRRWFRDLEAGHTSSHQAVGWQHFGPKIEAELRAHAERFGYQ